MWSLPSLKQLNTADRRLKLGKRTKCEHYDCTNTATHRDEIYNLFSDKPKYFFRGCDDHHAEYEEDNFHCEGCGRVQVLNLTWEKYQHESGVCLNCAFDEAILDETNYIRDISEITLERLKKAPHVIPVSGTHWQKHLNFVGNAEYDSTDGHQISGLTIKEEVAEALKKHKQVFVCLDGAFQFAVSIGFYVRK